jgi:hypothetical protein
LKKGLVHAIILCMGFLLNCAFADTDEKLLMGDKSDGSRAVPVHVIELLNQEGDKIKSDEEPLLPFSAKQTCGACHSYNTVKGGWHFDSLDANVPAGRVGQPWIYVDRATGTQVPVSYRNWPGVFRPEQFGLSTWEFTKLFGRQMPGGGPGEVESENFGEIARGFVSGKLEINCLACHDGNPGHDQAEYANEVARENFRWAAASSCSFARVSGSAKNMPDNYDYLMPSLTGEAASKEPKIEYLADTFDPKGKVFFDIRREILNERCYFCHSYIRTGEGSPERWEADEDVHLTSGMTCIDCHRNSVSHNIIRGYDGESAFSKNPIADDFSCRGCHLPHEGASTPEAGRLGAPIPKHNGLPEIHFKRMTCTACHSGPWPGDKTTPVKTSMAHGLGVYNIDKSPDALPHIATVVFAKEADGRISPQNLIWPAFWASLKEDKVTPLTPDAVRSVIQQVITETRSVEDGWLKFTDEQISKILTGLSSQGIVDGKAVYICGGKMYSQGGDGNLVAAENRSASAFMWPIGHNVRPAAQSLGVGGCGDCHATDKPFFFGKVSIDSPIVSQAGFVEMIKFAGVNKSYTKMFASSLLFYRFVAIISVVACVVAAAIIAVYAFAGLIRLFKIVARKD